MAQNEDPGRAPLPSPPPETPGPSVSAPELPESETEREEWVASTVPEGTLEEQEESEAAAEAAAIGGPGSPDAEDAAMQPLYEAGQGDQDGWEAAERDLIENATHSDGGGSPLRDAFSPEAESDRTGVQYGGADNTSSTQVTHDPAGDEDDPGDGPDVSADRHD